MIFLHKNFNNFSKKTAFQFSITNKMINSVRYERSNSSEQMQFNVLSDSGGGSSIGGGESPLTPSQTSTTTNNSNTDEPLGIGNVSELEFICMNLY